MQLGTIYPVDSAKLGGYLERTDYVLVKAQDEFAEQTMRLLITVTEYDKILARTNDALEGLSEQDVEGLIE